MEAPDLAPVTLTPPDTSIMAARVAPLEERARALKVTDQASAEVAADELKALTAMKKRIEDEFEPVVSSAHKTHRMLTAARLKFTEPVSRAIGIIKGTIGDWAAAERRRAEEEARAAAEKARREAEEKALAEAAAREEETGEAVDLDAVQAQVEAQVEDTQRQVARQASAPAVAGVTRRQLWRLKVTDLRALIEYVAAHPGTEHYLEPNMPLLTSMAKQAKDTLKIPGVTVYAEESIATRG